MSVNGTLVEEKMRRFKGECAHFSFNKFPIYAHDGASAKFSTNSQKTDNSAGHVKGLDQDQVGPYVSDVSYQLEPDQVTVSGTCKDGSHARSGQIT